MASSSYVFVLLSVLFLMFSPACLCLSFDIRNGEEICLGESVNAGDFLVAEYSVLPAGSRIQVFVFDPAGNQIYTRLAGSEPSGTVDDAATAAFDHKFAHTASNTGVYRVCFQNSVYSPNDGVYVKTVSFQFKSGLTTRDYAAVAKKDSLKPIEVHLKYLEDLTTNIHNEIKYLSQKEQELRGINDSTSRFVISFSILSIIVLVGLKIAEGIYLKKYFQAKKLLQ